MRSRLLFAALVVVAVISAGLAAVIVYRLDDERGTRRTVGAATSGWRLAGCTTATAFSDHVHLNVRRDGASASNKL